MLHYDFKSESHIQAWYEEVVYEMVIGPLARDLEESIASPEVRDSKQMLAYSLFLESLKNIREGLLTKIGKTEAAPPFTLEIALEEAVDDVSRRTQTPLR